MGYSPEVILANVAVTLATYVSPVTKYANLVKHLLTKFFVSVLDTSTVPFQSTILVSEQL